MCPGDFKNGTSTDLDMVRMVGRILNKHFATKILDFPELGFGSRLVQSRAIPGIYLLYFHIILGSKMKLLRALLRTEGVVYAGYLPVIFSVVIAKRLFALKYDVVAYVAGVPQSSKAPVRLMFHLLASSLLPQCA